MRNVPFNTKTEPGAPADEPKTVTTVGLEPTIFGSEDRRLIHWATRPRRANAHPHGIRVNCALLFLTKSFLCAKGARSTKNVTAVGFEPTPFRTSA